MENNNNKRKSYVCEDAMEVDGEPDGPPDPEPLNGDWCEEEEKRSTDGSDDGDDLDDFVENDEDPRNTLDERLAAIQQEDDDESVLLPANPKKKKARTTIEDNLNTITGALGLTADKLADLADAEDRKESEAAYKKYIAFLAKKITVSAKLDACFFSADRTWFFIAPGSKEHRELLHFLFRRYKRIEPSLTLLDGQHNLFQTAKQVLSLHENIRASPDIRAKFFVDVDTCQGENAWSQIKTMIRNTVDCMKQNLKVEGCGICVMILRSRNVTLDWNQKWHIVFHGPVLSFETIKEFFKIRFESSRWMTSDEAHVDPHPTCEHGHLRMPLAWDNTNTHGNSYHLTHVWNFDCTRMSARIQELYPPGEHILDTEEMTSGNLQGFQELMEMCCIIYADERYYDVKHSWHQFTAPSGQLLEKLRDWNHGRAGWINRQNIRLQQRARHSYNCADIEAMWSDPTDIFDLKKLADIYQEVMDSCNTAICNRQVLGEIVLKMNKYLIQTTDDGIIWTKGNNADTNGRLYTTFTPARMAEWASSHYYEIAMAEEDEQEEDDLVAYLTARGRRKKAKKKTKMVNICQLWTKHNARNNLKRAVFNPFPEGHPRSNPNLACFNLWRWCLITDEECLGYTQFEGLWMILDFIFRLFGQLYEPFFLYLDYLTYLFTMPYVKQMAAIWLAGDPGAGKSMLIRFTAGLFGQNAYYIGSTQELGGFNMSLAMKMLIVLDDVFQGTSHDMYNKLCIKDYVTSEETLRVEAKYHEARPMWNVLNFIIGIETKYIGKATEQQGIATGDRRSHLIACQEVDPFWDKETEKAPYMKALADCLFKGTFAVQKAFAYYLRQRFDTMMNSPRKYQPGRPPYQSQMRDYAMQVSSDCSADKWILQMVQVGVQVAPKFLSQDDPDMRKNIICDKRSVYEGWQSTPPLLGRYELFGQDERNLDSTFVGILSAIPEGQQRERVLRGVLTNLECWDLCNQSTQVREIYNTQNIPDHTRCWFEKLSMSVLYESYLEWHRGHKDVGRAVDKNVVKATLQRLIRCDVAETNKEISVVTIESDKLGHRVPKTIDQLDDIIRFPPYAVAKRIYQTKNSVQFDTKQQQKREEEILANPTGLDIELISRLQEYSKVGIREMWPIAKLNQWQRWQPSATPSPPSTPPQPSSPQETPLSTRRNINNNNNNNNAPPPPPPDSPLISNSNLGLFD